MPVEYITYDDPAEQRPTLDTPAKDFEDVWENGVEDPEVGALLNKHVYLGFLEHWATLYAIDTFVFTEGQAHVAAAIWAEDFDGYQAKIDIEKMFLAVKDEADEDLEKMIASFQRIIAHLEGLRR